MVFPDPTVSRFVSVARYKKILGINSDRAQNIIISESHSQFARLLPKKNKLIEETELDETTIFNKLVEEAKTRALLDYMLSHRRYISIHEGISNSIERDRLNNNGNMVVLNDKKKANKKETNVHFNFDEQFFKIYVID